MKRFAFVCLFLSAAIGSAATPEESIGRMKKDIFYLAGDECGGRLVGTPGNDRAADYIAAAFKFAGLEPGTKDGYFQPFVWRGRAKPGPESKLVLTIKGQPLPLTIDDQFTVHGNSAAAKASGDLVFVGYGLTADTKTVKYDDYAGLDVHGKVVVVLRKGPRAEQKDALFQGDLAEMTARVAKVSLAEKNGAAAVLFVNDKTDGGHADVLGSISQTRGPAAKIPVLQIERTTLDKLLATQGKKLADVETAIDKDSKPMSVELKECKAEARVDVVRTPVNCKNVVGVLPGSGPLADETIVIGGHYDHLGTDTTDSMAGPAAKGKVHFGADDNASGTTGVIELARRFGEMKNRYGRRLVFIAFSAEEEGLYGSEHYVKQPVVPLDKTVFMLNMDMIGRAAEVEVDGKKKFRVIASGTGVSDGFDKLCDAANARFDFKLLKTVAGGGPSDQKSFHDHKIPALFVHTGTHGDYHRPSDTPDKINLAAMKQIADFAEVIAAQVATAVERPNFNATKGHWSDPTDPRSQGDYGKMPKLGVTPNYDESEAGLKVQSVSPGGAAEAGGIKGGDLIVEIAGKKVSNIQDYMRVLAGQKAGVEIEVVVVRGKEKKPLKVTPKIEQ